MDSAQCAETGKWTADPGRRYGRPPESHTPTHLPSQHSPPRGGCRGAGGACERGRSALCAAWMRAQRVLPRRAACAVLRWSRGAWSARARVRSTDARREMGVCDGGRRRLKYGSGRACAATVVRSDARGPAPQSAIGGADRLLGGRILSRYRLSCVVVRNGHGNGMQILFESIA